MRDYILNRAIESGSMGFSMSSLFRSFMARRRLASLAKADDNLLRDIGLERADINWARHLPLSEDPMLALEDRVFRRARR